MPVRPEGESLYARPFVGGSTKVAVKGAGAVVVVVVADDVVVPPPPPPPQPARAAVTLMARMVLNIDGGLMGSIVWSAQRHIGDDWKPNVTADCQASHVTQELGGIVVIVCNQADRSR